MNNTYKLIKEYMKKYPMTIAWRLKRHSKIIEKHLNHNEEILYIFAGQKNNRMVDLVNTNIIVFTNKRIMIGTKRVIFGYFFKSITYDMYNDLSVYKGIIWGRVTIDTVKEVITITNIDARALDEIETNITEIMIKMKKKIENNSKKEKK